MRKLSYVKFLSVLLLQLGLISMSPMGRAETESDVPGTCDTAKALSIIATDSCAVFGPGAAGETTYNFALVSNYAVSGCVPGGSTNSTNTHHVYIEEIKITETQGTDGELDDLGDNDLNLTAIHGASNTINDTTNVGTLLVASGASTMLNGNASGTACSGVTTGQIAAPIHQMRDTKDQAAATTGSAFTSNWVDEHHNGEKYALKCAFASSACTYSNAATGGEGSDSVTFNAIVSSDTQTFPASQLAMVAQGIDPSKFPGDTITVEVILTSTYTSTGADSTNALFAYDSTVATKAY